MKYVIKAVSVLFIFAIFNGAYAHTDTKVVVIPMGDGVGKIYGSCKEILDAGASTGDGVYMIDTVGDGVPHLAVYCDMATGTTYEAFAFGNHSSTYVGYTQPDISTWQNAAFQQAFIWHHNSNDGFRNLDEGFASGNCCIYLENDKALRFGGWAIWPFTMDLTQACEISYPDGRYIFGKAGALSKPMATDYFTTNAVTETSACNNDNNPGVFMKSYQ